MYGYIYITTNLTNNKKYIGKHTSSKFDENYKGSGKRLWNAINKYGWDNFKVEIIEECNSLEELNERERYWISHYNATESDEFYNITEGGYGGFGKGINSIGFNRHHSEETRKKISMTKINNHYHHSEETRRKMRNNHANFNGDKNPRYGKEVTKDTRKKISESQKGKAWVSNVYETLRININDIDYYLSIGYIRGRKLLCINEED